MLAFLCSRFFAGLVATCVSASAVEIIAHRGASADAPENSLSAMKLAWEQGADAIELDLWLSKDGKLIVFHDADTKRIGGVDRKITEYTAEEAAQIDIGKWKGEKFAGEKLPALEPILATVPAGKRVVLELKSGKEVVPEFVRVIRACGLKPSQMCVISFKYDGLAESKKQLPELEHYYLAGYAKDKVTGAFPELAPLIAQAKAAGFEGLNLNLKWPMDEKFVADVKGKGLKLMVWTVDDPAEARKFAALKLDAITTNRPGFLREELKK